MTGDAHQPTKTMGPAVLRPGRRARIYRDWHRVLQEYPGDRMLVVEAWAGRLPGWPRRARTRRSRRSTSTS
ncbi:hypothetical protein QJS66_15930 [Kocuria rhizophila]|nr:hypothetical protein QJS66_15930 [Kocuria rhizophila]